MRHIMVVNVHFAPNTYGGATVVAEEVALALVRQGGVRVTAISTCQKETLAPYTVVKTEKLGIVNYLINLPPIRSRVEAYTNPHITARLAELVDVLRPDLIHAHCIQDMGTGIFTVAEAARIPVVLSVHDFWWICERQFMQRIDQSYCGQDPVRIEACKGCAEDFWAAKVRHDHLNCIGQRAALVTYPSHFALRLSEASGFAKGKGVVWENGVHLPGPEFFGDQQARRQADQRMVFGYLGGPSHIKGWPQIKQAFRRLERQDFDVRVVDGGLDAPWWQDNEIADLPGNWRIVPRYSQTQMDQFYAQIDVLLFMSQWKETFGLVIREALARGIRVIQTDSGGTVEHGGPMEPPPLPIGGSVSALKVQLEHVLDAHPCAQPVVQVQSFEQQAHAFSQLIDRVLLEDKVVFA